MPYLDSLYIKNLNGAISLERKVSSSNVKYVHISDYILFTFKSNFLLVEIWANTYFHQLDI